MKHTRPWIPAVAGLAAILLCAAAIAAFAGTGGDDGVGKVQTRGTHPLSVGATGDRPESTTTTTTTTDGAAFVAPDAATPTTVTAPGDDEPSPVTSATLAPPPSRTVSATTGLTNLAPVTMTATGLPNGPYYVGQCPTDTKLPTLQKCVMTRITEVSDGTLTATVHALWWIHGFDCGSAPGVCGVGFMNGRTNEIVAGYPVTFDTARRPRITVTPTDTLTDGQRVQVQGFDLGAGSVSIRECVPPTGPACSFVDVETNAAGDFTASLQVQRSFDWISRSGPATSTCGADGDCAIDVYFTPEVSRQTQMWITANQSVVLHFAPVSTSTTNAATP